MSDQEDDFMCEDVEDYGLEYSEDSNSEPDVDLENQYYNSKALKEDEPQAALASFQKVLDLEAGEKGEWGFKALKQMIKINFKLNNFDEMMVRYKQLLTYIKSAVTRNHSEKSINSILDYISTSKNMELLQDFYETTLEALKDAKNDRLWFKTNTKLGKLYFDRTDFTKLAKILKQLHQSCQTDDGEDDLKKGTQLLEIYALEIQMYTAQKNNKKLKTLYEQSLHIKSAIPHPLIMGVIRECGGKMHLREGEFEKAHTDFFEAFKNYDESGSPRRTTCLKYLVLANMLMKSDINPFDSQEAKPYKNDPEILAMTNLVNAYQTNDINEFESILKQNRQNIMDDPFIREHIEDLLRNIRTQVLIKLIKPYTRINIPFISRELNIDVSEVENLLVSCILDNTIRGRIDQVNHVLFLDQTSVNASRDESQPGPSGLQSNPGPSGIRPRSRSKSRSRVQYDSDSSDTECEPVPFATLYRTIAGSTDMESNPGPSSAPYKPNPADKPLVDHIIELLYYAVNTHNLRNWQDEHDAAVNTEQGGEDDDDDDMNNMPQYDYSAEVTSEGPHLDRSLSEITFADSDDSVEMPLEEDYVIAEIPYRHDDDTTSTTSTSTSSYEIRSPPPAPPRGTVNSFQLSLMRKRNRRYGRALFQNTTTIVDTLRRFVPHICRTIALLLQGLEIAIETEDPPRTLEHDMEIDHDMTDPSTTLFQYRFAHGEAHIRERPQEEERTTSPQVPIPNERDLHMFTHIVNAIARVMPYLFEAMFSSRTSREIEWKIKEMLEAYFKDLYTPEIVDFSDAPATMRHNREELTVLYGKVFRGTNTKVSVCSGFTNISQILSLGLDEILQYIRAVEHSVALEKDSKKE